MIDIVIPVGPGHIRYLQDALDSAFLSKIIRTVIVSNDTGDSLPSYIDLEDALVLDRHVVQDTPWGPGKGRNLGAAAGSAETIVFLDADDILVPGALSALWEAYIEHGRGVIVYGDVLRSDSLSIHRQMDQYCGPEIGRTALHQPKRMPTHLIPRAAHEAIGGWREDMPLWEDIEYEMRMDAYGVCAVHIDYPVYFYRLDTGTRRVSAEDDKVKQRARVQIYESLQPYFSGEKTMACGSCGSGSQIPQPPTPRQLAMRQGTQLMNLKTMLMQGAQLELEFVYPNREARTYLGPRTGRRYRFAQSVERLRKVRIGPGPDDVDPDDAAEMLTWHRENYRLFRLITLTPPTEQPAAAPQQRRQTEEAGRGTPEGLVSSSEQNTMQAEIMAIFEAREHKARGESEKPAPAAQAPAEAKEDGPVDIPSDGLADIRGFTIQAMRSLVESGSVDPDSARAWLRQEEASGSPRVGMIALLKSAL